MTKYSRPAVIEYTCNCSLIGKYHWILFKGEHTCPFCGAELVEVRIIHERIEWDYKLFVSRNGR